MTDTTDLVARLNAYFVSGGLFNPELANHTAVSELVRDSRDAIERLTRERDEARAAALEEAAKVADDMGREEQTNTRDVDALMQACAREEMGYEIAAAIRALKEPT
jgi:hypothetical protein